MKLKKGLLIGLLITLVAAPLLAAGLIALLLYLSVPDVEDQPHQQDEAMIANFESHRAGFELLLVMIQHDSGLIRVDADWTDPSDPPTVGVSAERIKEYRRLFRQLGIPRGFTASADRSRVDFIASTQGFLTHGSSKGYIYSPKPLLIDGLDNYQVEPRERYHYKHVADRWYLYFESH